MDKRIRIIIVDDELLLRRGIRYLCDWQAEGFEIAGEASDGLEGLELVRSLRPDLVITDIRMARMDGLDFTAQLKEEFPEIGVLVLSSYDNFQYVKTAFKNGAADYLLKPDLSRCRTSPFTWPQRGFSRNPPRRGRCFCRAWTLCWQRRSL